MIDRTQGLSLSKLARWSASAAAAWTTCHGPSAQPIWRCRRIDERHLEYPFAGARMRRDLLALAGVPVGRKHMTTLMRRMGIEAIYRKPNTSRRHPKNPIYP